MKAPLIDKRDMNELFKQMRELVPYYVPEWKAEDDKDPGVAVMKLFAQLYMGIVHRLNQVPDKNFIAFLNMLGVKLQPARPSRGPVTFYLSEGASDPVLVPAATQLAAQPADGGKPIIFETEKPILATPAKLVEAICYNPEEDGIYQAPAGFLLPARIKPFSSSLLIDTQAGGNRLYLEQLKGLNKGDALRVEGPEQAEYFEAENVEEDAIIASDPLLRPHTAGSPVRRVTDFELFEGKNKQTHILYLGHRELFNVESQVSFALDLSGASLTVQQGELLASSVEWHYWSEDNRWSELSVELEYSENGAGRLLLKKKQPIRIQETEIDGFRCRWLRGVAAPSAIRLLQEVQLRSLNVTVLNDELPPAPDLAFYNDIPLDPTSALYPFGRTPRLYDTLYLASQEALSKKGAEVQIRFTLEHDNPNNLPDDTITTDLSWEYWNGKGWMKLAGISENFSVKRTGSGAIRLDRKIAFVNPPDSSEVMIQGQLNYWIRVRIVSGGYGTEVLALKISEYALTRNYVVPKISGLKLQYGQSSSGSPTNLEHIVTRNNMEFRDRTAEVAGGRPFRPFYTLEDKHQSLYLGFDRPPLKGPVSLYFSVMEQEYAEDNRPRLEWEYYRVQDGQGSWAKLDVRDETRHLTQNGCIEFIGPADFMELVMFGKRLIWIRGIDAEDKFVPAGRSLDAGKRASQGDPSSAAAATPDSRCNCAPPACSDTVDLFDLRFNLADQMREFPPAPKLNGIYLNSAMVTHAESIPEEMLGSSSGTASLGFNFSRFPVLSEEIYVNEMNALSEGERQDLAESGSVPVREVKDGSGQTTGFWVRWSPVDDLKESKAGDRHYEIDRTFGTIRFGDGVHGMVPPIGTDNVKAVYRTGGGAIGNVGPSEITMLKTSIAFIDRVSNPDGAAGGFDTERMEQALERGPHSIKHRNRAVTAEDYEQLALQAAQGIARVKCLPGWNDQGEHEAGWVTVIVVPQSGDRQPSPTPQLRRQVQSYLEARASNVAVFPNHLKVIGPVYVEISISTVLAARTFDAVPAVEREAMRKLSAFLHPLSGGPDGRGWEFGRLPCLSDFYALLEADRNVDHVETLSMTIRDPATGNSIEVTPDRPIAAGSGPFFLIYSGEHKTTVRASAASPY
ncbi:putative baseplate assembly protein [Paenibacillus sp. HJGM_3]|uniref:putative baseplate assembly protein n=1 Tax=Paenibacillus sp. HJGM_3 TaxID=3379816 RepID=UPI00385EF96C